MVPTDRPGHRRRARVGLATLAVGALAAATVWVAAGTASAATVTATVTVNAATTVATVPSTLVGANVAVWDSYLADAQTGTLMKNAGVKYIRYPGGSYADIYHWQTGTADNGGYVAPNTGFDAYMGMVQAAGAQPIIIANYGSGTPTEAAAWVRYANVTKGYGAKYWEIGNEVYGNGHYGSSWENDTHADKSPTAYATNFLQFASAMKAVDSTIKIGVVLTTPGYWPDGIVGSGDSADWNHTVMSIVKNAADFVIFHWYPGGNNEADMLTKPATMATSVSSLRSVVNQYATNNPPIFVTELNGGPPRDTQAQALWAADQYLSAAEAGVANLDWWNVHNGSGASGTDVTGATDYGDEGIISNGSGGEPAAQTPFAPYYGIQMLSRVVAGGDTLVKATTSDPKLTVHAIKRANGNLDVLLINKDPANTYSVNLSYSGYSPAAAAGMDVFANRATAIVATSGTATSQSVGPYSLVAVHLRPGGTTGSPSASRSASPSPSRSASTSPSASRSASASPSRSVPPRAGTCRVSYTANSWNTGFTGSVSVTNTGTSTVNGWRLTWTFPGNQQVTSGWNATITQSGTAVTATNMSYNATIAPNAAVSFGFNASYSGTNTNPTSFALNGTACTVQ